MNVEIAGENSLIIYFGETTDPLVSAQVQQAAARLETVMADTLIDMVPSYASLLVIYDQFKTDHYAVRRHIRETLTQLDDAELQAGQIITLPVYYSAESGPDLEALAENAKLTVAEVIKIHSEMEYRVYAIGFAPGFAYLGEVDPRIAAARLSTPRLKVPRGAVAIADRQTAVYPAVSPGGWNLIGLCPTRMFNPEADPTMPVQVGDRVRFSPIERAEFLALGGEL
ncbi:5-oxoprolinase subunit PxpB [Neptunomonas sp.]|uniref:5-oxoprolinase subunit PxpB n=1 Tax=Neptunomonas sp. TaxID=1971898 RepID=UPI0025FFDD26|nr:5-oxoprolinase subunit PxpB [Neptunomonas sp.]